MASQIIPDAWAFPFLAVQRGRIWEFRDDREKWWAAYERDLFEAFDSFVDILPDECERVLDIGGGMGGINIHVAKAFARQPQIVIVDGVADEATVSRHGRTFNSAGVGEQFLGRNGVERVAYIAPPVATADKVGPCDVVLSFQAWPFHIPVDEYLNLAKRALKPGGLLVVDVRKGKPGDLAALGKAFKFYRVLASHPKFERVAYVAE